MQKNFRRPLRWGGLADIAVFALAAAFVVILALGADMDRALAAETGRGGLTIAFVYILFIFGTLAFTAILGIVSLFVGMNALHGVGAWAENARIAAHIKNSMALPVIFLIAAVPALFFMRAFPAAVAFPARIALVCIGSALVLCLLASAAGKVMSGSRLLHLLAQPEQERENDL